MAKLKSILGIKTDFENLYDNNNVLVVDFMSLLRRLLIKDFLNFEELLVAWYNYIKVALKFNELHTVFNSYIAGSLKECERKRRSTFERLGFDRLSPSTNIPSRLEIFWVRGANKQKLQGISWTFLINVSKENEISGFVAFDDEINDAIKFQKENSVIQQDLNSTIEEVVIHLIRYAN